MWDGTSPLLCGCCHTFSREVCSPVVRVALWVRLDQSLFSLSACLAPKEGIAETSEARAFTEGLHTYVGAVLILSPGFCPFLIVFIPDLVYGYGVERLWLQELRWPCCHEKSGCLCGTFLPGYSAPEPALNCSEEQVGLSCQAGRQNCSRLLGPPNHMLTMGTTPSRSHLRAPSLSLSS